MTSASSPTTRVGNRNPIELVPLASTPDKHALFFRSMIGQVNKRSCTGVDIDSEHRSKVTLTDRNVFFIFKFQKGATTEVNGWQSTEPADDITNSGFLFAVTEEEKPTEWILLGTTKTVKYKQREDNNHKFTEIMTSWKYYVLAENLTKENLRIEAHD